MGMHRWARSRRPRQLSHQLDVRRGSVAAWTSRQSRRAIDHSARLANLPPFDFERRALVPAGRDDLAALVRHVAVEDGDGLGYDVLSFDPIADEPLFIEVKTTRYSRELPFYVTRNEIEFSEEVRGAYRLARVYQFGRHAGHFRLTGSLRHSVWLDPQTYIGGPAEQVP